MSSAAISAAIAALEAELAKVNAEIEKCKELISVLEKILSDVSNSKFNLGKALSHMANGLRLNKKTYGEDKFNERINFLKKYSGSTETAIQVVKKRLNELIIKRQQIINEIAALRVALAEALAREAAARRAAEEASWYSGGGGGSSSPAPTYNGSGCFLKGTKVAIMDGYKDIDDIKIGDMVLSYNIETGKNEYKKVIELFLHPKEKDTLYSIFVNEKLIEASSAHKFFIKTNNGFDWIKAEDLKIGNIVLDSNGNYYSITNITSKSIEEDLYNIEVEDNHNYYVTEAKILVHNRK